MKLATLKQARKVLELLEGLPLEQLQNLLESGLLYDFLRANVGEMMDRMTRNDFRKFCGLVPVSTEFPVWKTIKIGTGLKTSDDFRKSINENEMEINYPANDILGKSDFAVAIKETELDLVKATVAELGFKNGARCDQIYARAKELGWELCPSEVGPQLRLQYQNQPNGESVLIAMEPIADSGGTLRVFNVKRSDFGLLLYDHPGYADSFWSHVNQWVFVRPRK